MTINNDIPALTNTEKFLGVLLLTLAFASGVWVERIRVAAPENTAAAPEVRQKDGSLILARTSNPTPPAAPHIIPHKMTEMRRITSTMKPKTPNCPPVTTTTSIVKDGDGGLRAIVSAGDDTVVTGQDMVIHPLNLSPKPKVWAAEVLYDPFHQHYGARVSRDIGPVRLSANAIQRSATRVDTFIGVGISF